MKQELQKELSELKQKVESIEKRIESMPDEKGKWVPKFDDQYYFIDSGGCIEAFTNTEHEKDIGHIARGNCYPTEQAAIEAKEQQDFWRDWLSAGDVPSDKSGYIIRFDCKKIDIVWTACEYPMPKFTSTQKAREWVDSHGGPDVVRERLAMGWV